MAHGDFGMSLRTSKPVLTLIGPEAARHHPTSGDVDVSRAADRIPTGILSAVRREVTDYIGQHHRAVGLSIPNFWLGIMMILLFLSEAGWLPAQLRVACRRPDPVAQNDDHAVARMAR